MLKIMEFAKSPRVINWLKQFPGTAAAWCKNFANARINNVTTFGKNVIYLSRNPHVVVTWVKGLPHAIRVWFHESFVENFQRVYLVGKNFWLSEERHTARVMLAVILGFVALNAGVNKIMADASVPYNSYMKDGPLPMYEAAALYYMLWMVISTMVQAASNVSRTRLQLKWRRYLTIDLRDLYLKARNFLWFTLDLSDTKPDNPDQRLTQDPDTFTNSSVNLSMSGLDALVGILVMGWELIQIYPQLLVWSLGCALFISAMVWLLGKPLRFVQNRWYTTEADLRFVYQQTRDEAEGIALARGEDIVRENIETSIDNVIGNLLSQMWIYFRMQLCTIFYYTAVPLLPVAVVIKLYFDGHIEYGLIGKVLIAFTTVTGGLTFFVNNFPGLMQYFTVSQRIFDIMQALQSYVKQLPFEKQVTLVEGNVAAFKNVTLENELNQPVIVDLDIVLDKSTLISGPDVVQKGTLLRALDGVARRGSGEITRPQHDCVMFLPQAPWLPTSSLRKALTFGLTGQFTDQQLLDILQKVQLPDLAAQAGGLDAPQVKNWRKILPSLAHQQRLALARVLLWLQTPPAVPAGDGATAKLRYVFLDKPTGSLEEENEDLLYELLSQTKCIVISTAIGARLAKHHEQVLEIKGHPVDGQKNWDFHPVAGEYKVPGWKIALKRVGIIENPAPSE